MADRMDSMVGEGALAPLPAIQHQSGKACTSQAADRESQSAGRRSHIADRRWLLAAES